MRSFLAIAAVLAWCCGAMLLVTPFTICAATDFGLPPLATIIAEAHGLILMSLGVVNWVARSRGKSDLVTVLLYNLAGQILSLLLVIRALCPSAGLAVGTGAMVCVLPGIWFGWLIVRPRRLA